MKPSLFPKRESSRMQEVRQLEIQLKGCRTRLMNLRRRIEEMENDAKANQEVSLDTDPA